MIDRLSASDVEDGKAHPFVVALLKELREKRAALHATIEASAALHTADGLRAHAGRAAALTDILRTIENAKGRSDDE